MIRIAAALLLALASVASADNPQLAEARKAIDEVRYDDAQRLLVAALERGGSSPAEVRELYRLSASTAVVMGQVDVGEQYYRRWLALEPTATLSMDLAPKLREPFEKARAYIAAHGRLEATGGRATSRELAIAIVSDPLAMARGVRLGATTVPLDGERRARVPSPTEDAVVVAVVDQHGNTLVELDVAPGAGRAAGPVDDGAHEPKRSMRWLAFGIPSAVLLLGGLGVSALAINDWQVAQEEISDSSQHYFADVEGRIARSKVLAYAGAGAATLGLVLAVPALVMLARSKPAPAEVTPIADGDTVGLALSGRF